MQRKIVGTLSPLLVAVLLVGCGSSSSSSNSSSSTAANAAKTYGSASTPSATAAALITTKHAKLGTILADGSKKLTVYLFESDKGSTSSCSATCASVWPPVSGKPQAAGGALASKLRTIKRPDGTTQVTYNGHPLYLYVKDKDAGDAYGQGSNQFGAGWYVLKPSGAKLDKS